MRMVKRGSRSKSVALASIRHFPMISWRGTKCPITITSGSTWPCSSTYTMMQISGAICSISVRSSISPKRRYPLLLSVSSNIWTTDNMSDKTVWSTQSSAQLNRSSARPRGWWWDHYDKWFKIASYERSWLWRSIQTKVHDNQAISRDYLNIRVNSEPKIDRFNRNLNNTVTSNQTVKFWQNYLTSCPLQSIASDIGQQLKRSRSHTGP